jgi:excisionase family DNA binding protein
VAAPKAVQAHPRGAEDRRTLTVAEAARILGIGRTKAYELAARNALPVRVIRLGRRLLVSRVELEAFLRGGDTAQPVQDGQPGAPGSGLTVDAPRVAV